MMKSAYHFEAVVRNRQECTGHIAEVLIFAVKTYKSPDSSVGIATGHGGGWPREFKSR
jgi:hypothetical protein